jgi:hypothetical protein
VAEEDEEDHEDDVWSDTPAADAEEGIPEGGSHEDSKASDELSPEPAGLESDFRFNLNDMKVDKILGTTLNAQHHAHLLLCSIQCCFLRTTRSIEEQRFTKTMRCLYHTWVELTLPSALLCSTLLCTSSTGRGSFATVNMGSISGQQAAIKCMRKVRLRIEKQGSFVQREREILRRLCIPPEGACPLIIKCFGTAQDDESVSENAVEIPATVATLQHCTA